MTTAQEAFEKWAVTANNPKTAANVLLKNAESGEYVWSGTSYAWTVWQASRQDSMAMIAELVGAAKALEPYTDAIICYASTMDEHEPNRLVFNLKAALTKAEKFMGGV